MSLLDFFGKWPGSSQEIENIKRTLEKDRKNLRVRRVIFKD